MKSVQQPNKQLPEATTRRTVPRRNIVSASLYLTYASRIPPKIKRVIAIQQQNAPTDSTGLIASPTGDSPEETKKLSPPRLILAGR
mmetsp:Transcript_4045/g.9648  ORF Transcript_4045/g.9648 Transcript_4045/m.9648 type:complete len:86 (-) Transcript_4045:416-673(-)